MEGKSGVRKIDTFDASDCASQIAGLPVCGTEPGQYNPDSVVEPRDQRKMDKGIVYGVVAADEAMRDAGLIGLYRRQRTYRCIDWYGYRWFEYNL